jgi:hypothetical protein|tara:strand:- start:163 stop:1449 length:1287 start_codon:yes stop_codon:yes gene_type:complete
MSVKNLQASGVLYTDRRDFYIDPQVVKELWTDVAPFTTVVSNRETRQINDPMFKMFEHRNPWVKQKMVNKATTPTVANSDAESGNIEVDGIENLPATLDSSYIGLQVEVWNSAETTRKGVGLITSFNGANIKIKNMTTTAFTFVDNDVMYVVGNARGEGTSSPEAWSDELKVVYNSSQIFKTSLEITGTLHAASLRGEASELARLRLQKSQEHKMQKEKAFLFGQSVAGTNLSGTDTFADAHRTDADGKKVRSTMGLVTAIDKYGNSSGDDQNIFAIDSSSYNYSGFVDDMEKVFQYVPESGTKIAFCGAGALSYWSKIDGTSGIAGKSNWDVQLSPSTRDSLGFNYRMLETPHGMIKLVPTPALRGPYNKYMVVISDENLFHAQYRAPLYQTSVKTDNAYDGVKDQYMSDEGIGISLIESHKVFKIT